MTEKLALPAGSFAPWLCSILRALTEETGVDVPCGECTACCRSSQFIHVRPEEVQALSRIPGELLFPAPGQPEGTLLLGFDEHGRCPMLIEEKCSIYKYRPLTCRNYDCRVFSAAGISAGEDEEGPINRQAQRWKFSYSTGSDRNLHSAVLAAATFLIGRTERFPAGVVPTNSTQLALLAIKVHDIFLKHIEQCSGTEHTPPDSEIAAAVIEAIENF
ncbi:YkgJ family cysteine cluster protein [Gemmatimonadota bacterium]